MTVDGSGGGDKEQLTLEQFWSGALSMMLVYLRELQY